MPKDDDKQLCDWRRLTQTMLEAFEFDNQTRSVSTELEPYNSSSSFLITVLWKLALDTNYNAAERFSDVIQEFREVEEFLKRLPHNSTEYEPALFKWFELSATLRKELRKILSDAPFDPLEHPHRYKIRQLFIHNYR